MFFIILQITILVCSLLITALTTNTIPVVNTPWITPGIGLTISFLTLVITHFRFGERSQNFQQTADAIKSEISYATRGIFGYKNLSEKECYIKLAEEVEKILNKHRQQQQQLEQTSPITKHDIESSQVLR